MKALGCAGIGTCLDLAAPSTTAAASQADSRPGAEAPASAPSPAGDVNAALFRPHVGERFTVVSSTNKRFSVTLAEVAERPVSRGVEQFSLIFHGAPDLGHPEGTHAFSHARLGTLNIFVSPIGPKNERRSVCQACFCRHQTASGHRRT